jgi:hypothetical protein
MKRKKTMIGTCDLCHDTEVVVRQDPIPEAFYRSASGFTYTVEPGVVHIWEPNIPRTYTSSYTCGTATAGQTIKCTERNIYIGP